MSYYRDIVIQTYHNAGAPSSRSVRARPVAGQGFSVQLNVECSTKMREAHPVGTFMVVRAKITDVEGTPFVYTHYNWPYEVVTEVEAKSFILRQKRG